MVVASRNPTRLVSTTDIASELRRVGVGEPCHGEGGLSRFRKWGYWEVVGLPERSDKLKKGASAPFFLLKLIAFHFQQNDYEIMCST
jgi:hypothetical protein